MKAIGDVFCTFEAAIPFDEFVRHHPPMIASRAPRATGPRAPAMSADIREALLRECPWLRPSDLDERKVEEVAERAVDRAAARGSASSSAGVVSPIEVQMMSDSDVATAVEELKEYRDDMFVDDDSSFFTSAS